MAHKAKPGGLPILGKSMSYCFKMFNEKRAETPVIDITSHACAKTLACTPTTKKKIKDCSLIFLYCIFSRLFLKFICMHVCLCDYVYHMHAGACVEQKEASGPTELIDGHEPLGGCWEQSQFFCKSSTFLLTTEPLSRSSSLQFNILDLILFV